MPDEIQANLPTGPNGERLELRIGSKSFGINAKDIISVIVMIGAFAGFYLVTLNLQAGQTQGFLGLTRVIEQNNTHQNQLLDKMSINQAVLIELVHKNRQEMSEELTRQNTLLNHEMAAVHRSVDDQTKDLRKMLISINWNIGHGPDERIPVEFLPSEVPQGKRDR